MKLLFKPLLLCLFSVVFSPVFSQSGIKINLQSSFSKPGDELGQVAVKNHELQPSLNIEIPVVRLTYLPKKELGVRVSAYGSYDFGNYASNDFYTLIKAKIPSVGMRIYPVTKPMSIQKLMDETTEIPAGLIPAIAYILVVNSLHFDIGVGRATIEESAYLDDYYFEPETVHRTTHCFGWGFQPQLYASEDDKFVLNAVFDFGRYKWTNGNGGTSSLKYGYLGFGLGFKL